MVKRKILVNCNGNCSREMLADKWNKEKQWVILIMQKNYMQVQGVW